MDEFQDFMNISTFTKQNESLYWLCDNDTGQRALYAEKDVQKIPLITKVNWSRCLQRKIDPIENVLTEKDHVIQISLFSFFSLIMFFFFFS